MGLYQSVDFMVVNGLLDGFSKSDKEILAMPVVKYIYKLTFSPTGHFYIGKTHRLKDRFYKHIQTIRDVGNNVSDIKNCHPFHLTMGPIMRMHYEAAEYGRKKKPSFEIFIRQSMSAYIYSICGDEETGTLVESFYIRKFIKDPLCLNTVI